jgi:hypothetical protein
MKRELRGKKSGSDQRSGTRFREVDGSLKKVRRLLSKGGTSKKRPSPHLHKVPTRSNKVSPRTSQTVLVDEGQYINGVIHSLILRSLSSQLLCTDNRKGSFCLNVSVHLKRRVFAILTGFPFWRSPCKL